MTDQPITSVLFDLDNTLIDRSEAFRRLFGHWYDTLPTPTVHLTEKSSFLVWRATA